MSEEQDVEIDALIAELLSQPSLESEPELELDEEVEIPPVVAEPHPIEEEERSEYPLPEQKPVKYTNVDVVIMPHGSKSEYPLPPHASKSESESGTEIKTESELLKFADSSPDLVLDAANGVLTAEGLFSVPVTVASSRHVYDYIRFKALKPFAELQAASTFAHNIPVTREHPRAGIVTDRREVLGFFRNPIAEDDLLKGILEISDKDLIADIQAGKLSEVSPGFFCNLDRTSSGDLEGVHFDATQRDIFLNHIAVTQAGRCNLNAGCGIQLDGYPYPLPPNALDKLDAAITRAKAMKDKSLLFLLLELRKIIVASSLKKKRKAKDSPLLDPSKLLKLKDAFLALKAERDSLRVELEEIVKADRDSLVEELESLQDSKTKDDLGHLGLDELKKELDMVKELKANRFSFPDMSKNSSSRKSIDEAYGKIGGK